MKIVQINKTGYGYEIDKPIKTFSVSGSYEYLNSLKPKEGIFVKWIRDGSMPSTINKHIIDVYSILVFYSNSTENIIEMRRYQLYLDMYNACNDETCPEGFEFRAD